MSQFANHDDAKERVRQAVDIVDLLGSYIDLRRQGRLYVGLCPWHDDSRPSLQVNQERQSWKCWVCNVGGDIFSFTMQREGLEFREALRMLAERAGVPLHSGREPAPSPGGPGDKNTLYKAMAWAEQLFHDCLCKSPEGASARAYLQERGITGESLARWRLGFAPDSWQWLLDRARGTPFSSEVLEAVGLAGRSPSSGRPYDRFKGRVIFPIRDLQRRTVAFGGRVLPEFAKDDQAKYINSPETRLFSKSETLYGLDWASDLNRKQAVKHLMIMEGYTDVIVAHQCGLADAVAVLGTAFNERHLQFLRRRGLADQLTLVLDGDDAGQKRASELLQLFVSHQVDLRILTLPDGLDPADFLLAQGAEAFRALLAGAVDALEHKFRLATRGLNTLHDTHGVTVALEEMLATIAAAPRFQTAGTTDHKVREQRMLTQLARQFQFDEVLLRERLTAFRRGAKKSEPTTPAAAQVPLDPAECEVLELLTLHSELVPAAAAALPATLLAAGPVREIFTRFCELAAAGGEATFARVLATLEDPRLQAVLVRCDEQAQAKAVSQSQVKMGVRPTAAEQLAGMAAALHRRWEQRERLARQRTLEETNLSEEEKLSLLLESLAQQRSRQGISASTDGQDTTRR